MRVPAVRPLPLERSTRRALWASIVSMLFVALVSATPRSPFHPRLPESVQAIGPLRWLADLVRLQYLDDLGLMAVGLLATATAAVGFILVLREAWNGRLSMRAVVLLTIAYHVAVVTLPLLFSRDVYSYAYYGRIFSTYADNPYVVPPRAYSLNSLWRYTWPGWRGTTSVYGPLFTWISAFMTTFAKSLQSLITGFQLLAAAASIGTVAILARLVDKVRPERAVFAAAIVGLNPIVVFHVVGGGHNDILVALFVAAAVALLYARRELLSAIALGLGMSVKATAVVPLLLLIVAAAAHADPSRRRVTLVRYAGVVGAVWLLLALPFLQADNPSLGLLEVASHDSWMAPGQLVVRAFSGIGGLIGGEAARAPAALAGRLVLFAMSVAGVVMIARRIWRDPAARTPAALTAAWGWALLIVILPSPVLFTWYLVWILPLAWALPRVPRRAMVILSGFFIVTQLVTESARLPDVLERVKLPFGHPIAIAVLVWVGVDFVRRIRRDIPFDAETAQPVLGDRFEAGPFPRHDVPAAIGSPQGVPAPAMRRR
jgi:alpha-1,6-mannosyltransferase